MREMTDLSSQIRYSADVMLGAALDMAAELMECGAEIQRTEDTVERICRAYGASRVDVYVTTSLIVATVGMPDGYHKTQTRRIYYSQSNLSRIEELNSLSRKICENIPEPVEFEKMLRQSKKTENPRRKIITRYVGSLLLAAGFTVFFEGSAMDALAAAVVGLCIPTLNLFKYKHTNAMAHTVMCSLVAGVLSVLAIAVGFGDHADKVMIGTIMLLIPGVDIGNSLRDLFFGDIVSGSMRLIKALLTATAIAVGYSIAILLGGLLNVI